MREGEPIAAIVSVDGLRALRHVAENVVDRVVASQNPTVPETRA